MYLSIQDIDLRADSIRTIRSVHDGETARFGNASRKDAAAFLREGCGRR